MIIRLMGANFSANNIGELTTWGISWGGDGYTYDGTLPTSVKKNDPFSVTVKVASGYTYDSVPITITMGGTDITESAITRNSAGTITINIASVTSKLIITIGEVTSTNCTFTINPDPTSATVTLTAPGYTQNGNSITVPNGTTVSWKVSADGYTEQNGTWTANGSDETLPVTLSAIAPAGNVMDYVVDGKSITGLSGLGNNAEFFSVVDYPVVAGHKYSIPYARNGYFTNESGFVSDKIFQGGGKASYSVTALEGATKMSVCFKHVDISPENASITDLGVA